MNDLDLLQQTIEQFWDAIPPVWGHVRSQARAYAVQDFGVSLIQFEILRHIRRGAHSVAELAERQQISRPAVSQAVDSLVEEGLVSRSQDPQDRRFVDLELTERGRALINAIFTKNRQWMMEKMKELRPDEMETIIRALGILKETLG